MWHDLKDSYPTEEGLYVVKYERYRDIYYDIAYYIPSKEEFFTNEGGPVLGELLKYKKLKLDE